MFGFRPLASLRKDILEEVGRAKHLFKKYFLTTSFLSFNFINKMAKICVPGQERYFQQGYVMTVTLQAW